MKNIRFCLTVLFLFIAVSVYADLAFEPVAVTQQNDFLFRTVETIGQNTAVHTLYHGSFSAAQGKAVFEALSYYPENLIYAEKSGKIYIQNKTGLYVYDLAKKNVKTIGICPGMHKGDEYPIYRPEEAAVSPNDRFVLSKNAVSPTKGSRIRPPVADRIRLHQAVPRTSPIRTKPRQAQPRFRRHST